LVLKEAAFNGMDVDSHAKFLVHSELENNTLCPLLSDYAPRDNLAIYFVCPNREYLSLKVRLFIDQFHDFVHDRAHNKLA